MTLVQICRSVTDTHSYNLVFKLPLPVGRREHGQNVMTFFQETHQDLLYVFESIQENPINPVVTLYYRISMKL